MHPQHRPRGRPTHRDAVAVRTSPYPFPVSETPVPHDHGGPVLDRDGPVWHGVLPGLGRIQIDADGALDVSAAHASEEDETALRHGWGDLLAFAHRGFSMAQGAAVTQGGRPDGSPGPALLLTGDAHDIADVVLVLCARGWRLLSDRPTPVAWQDDTLVAQPRPAPLVVAAQRAAGAGLAGRPVRAGSNAVAVTVPRAVEPAPVAAIVQVQRRRPDEAPFAEVLGQRRFERAATLMLHGALAPDHGAGDAGAESGEAMVAEHVRLAALPSALVRLDGPADEAAVDLLVAWWTAAGGSP